MEIHNCDSDSFTLFTLSLSLSLLLLLLLIDNGIPYKGMTVYCGSPIYLIEGIMHCCYYIVVSNIMKSCFNSSYSISLLKILYKLLVPKILYFCSCWLEGSFSLSITT